MRQRSVLIAPPSLRPVLDALMDLSAAGTIDDFSWIEVSSDPATAPDREDPRSLHVSGGTVRASTFSSTTNRRGLDLVRMVVLVPLGHPAEDALSSTAENFYQGLDIVAGAEKTYTRVLIPWSSEAVPAELGRAGWHDVVLSPESTSEPGFSAVPWWNHPEKIAGAAAVGAAAQSGIVRGVDAAPSDEKRQDISTEAEIVRTFVRRIDPSGVESAVRSQVLWLGEQVPQPMREVGSPVPPYPSPENKVRDVAQIWGQRYRAAVRRPAPDLPHTDGRSVGLLTAVGLFFSFMFRAVLGAPEAWLRKVLHSARASLAAGSTALIFGRSPAVSVIVGGVAPDGSTAGWRAIRDAATEVARDASHEGELRGQPLRRDFSALWADLLQGGRALLDGSLCSNLGIDSAAGYVPERSHVAPGLDRGGAYVIPEALGALPSETVLHPWDHLEIDRVLHELEQAASAENAHAQVARRHVTGIRAWREETGSSFISRVGAHLSSWFDGARADISDTVSELEQLLGSETDEALGRAQRKLAQLLRAILLLTAGAVAVLVVLGFLDVLSWLVAGIAIGAVLLMWLISSLGTFLQRQREVFVLLQRRELQEARVPVLRERLRMATEDLDALGQAYAEFDRWAMLLTLFLDKPFGEEDGGATAVAEEWTLPDAMQAPQVVADRGRADDAAAQLRSSLFTVGWLTTAFERFEAHIPEALTSEQRVRMRQGNARPLTQLLSTRGDGGTELARWAEFTVDHGVRSDHGGQLWSRCLQHLSSSNLLDLQILPDGGVGEDPGTVEDLRAELRSVRAVSVVEEILQLGARTHENRIVDPAYGWLKEESDGLGSTSVLVQSTRPIAQENFVYPHGRPAHAVDDGTRGDDGLQPLPDDIVF